jgi:hypothetical protein
MDEGKLKQLKDIFDTLNATKREDGEKDDNATVIQEPPKKTKQVRKKREYTDEQKEAMHERMKSMREKSLAKRQAKAQEKKGATPKVVDEPKAVIKQAEPANDIEILKKELNDLKAKLNTPKQEVKTEEKPKPIIPLLSKAPPPAQPPAQPPAPPPPSVNDILGKWGRKRFK